MLPAAGSHAVNRPRAHRHAPSASTQRYSCRLYSWLNQPAHSSHTVRCHPPQPNTSPILSRTRQTVRISSQYVSILRAVSFYIDITLEIDVVISLIRLRFLPIQAHQATSPNTKRETDTARTHNVSPLYIDLAPITVPCLDMPISAVRPDAPPTGDLRRRSRASAPVESSLSGSGMESRIALLDCVGDSNSTLPECLVWFNPRSGVDRSQRLARLHRRNRFQSARASLRPLREVRGVSGTCLVARPGPAARIHASQPAQQSADHGIRPFSAVPRSFATCFRFART